MYFVLKRTLFLKKLEQNTLRILQSQTYEKAAKAELRGQVTPLAVN